MKEDTFCRRNNAICHDLLSRLAPGIQDGEGRLVEERQLIAFERCTSAFLNYNAGYAIVCQPQRGDETNRVSPNNDDGITPMRGSPELSQVLYRHTRIL